MERQFSNGADKRETSCQKRDLCKTLASSWGHTASYWKENYMKSPIFQLSRKLLIFRNEL